MPFQFPLEQTKDALSNEKLRTAILTAAWMTMDQGQMSEEFFIDSVRLNAPQYGESELYREAIQIALKHEAITTARRLARLGAEAYPENEVLRNYERVLAPPRVVETGTRTGRDFSKSMRWLAAHSHEYVGQWLALRNGELLRTDTSRKALIAQLGAVANEKDLLITRVPET
jgi:hypothetical protein